MRLSSFTYEWISGCISRVHFVVTLCWVGCYTLGILGSYLEVTQRRLDSNIRGFALTCETIRGAGPVVCKAVYGVAAFYASSMSRDSSLVKVHKPRKSGDRPAWWASVWVARPTLLEYHSRDEKTRGQRGENNMGQDCREPRVVWQLEADAERWKGLHSALLCAG